MHDVDPSIIEDVKAAYTAFQELVTAKAGDRTSFDSMVSGIFEQDDQTSLLHRKAMFKGARHYWGSQIDTYLTVGINHPAATPGVFDYAHLRIKSGLQRLRSDTDVIADSFKLSVASDGEDTFARQPLDREAAMKYSAPILPEFCTKPLPELRTAQARNGTTISEFIGTEVGRSSAANLVFGQVSRASQLSPSSDGSGLGFGDNIRITTPTALLIADMLVHRPTFPQLNPFLNVYDLINTDAGLEFHRPPVKLAFSERIKKFDGGPQDAWTREVPRYTEILRYVHGCLGWKLEDFDLYRVRIEYPLLHTRIAMGFDIPNSKYVADVDWVI